MLINYLEKVKQSTINRTSNGDWHGGRHGKNVTQREQCHPKPEWYFAMSPDMKGHILLYIATKVFNGQPYKTPDNETLTCDLWWYFQQMMTNFDVGFHTAP